MRTKQTDQMGADEYKYGSWGVTESGQSSGGFREMGEEEEEERREGAGVSSSSSSSSERARSENKISSSRDGYEKAEAETAHRTPHIAHYGPEGIITSGRFWSAAHGKGPEGE